MPIPVPTPINLSDNVTTSSTAQAAFEVMEAKFNDAQSWASYAMDIVETKLDGITAASSSFDISSYFTAAEDALTAIPDPPALSAITFDAPSLRGTYATLPTPTEHTAGEAPDPSVSFTNSDFTDTLLTTLKTKLEAELATASTGLGDAETALFARETARQDAVRAQAYIEITEQFSARGFDLPSGALLSKQTEMNNQSTIRLADSSSQIMAESAKLAQAWNRDVLATATSVVDALSKIHDNKILRDFEAAKSSVLMAVEVYKASIQEAIAAADLESKYIKAVAEGNNSLASMLEAEASAQSAYVRAQGERNTAEAAGFDATSRKAIAVASLAKDMAVSNIEAATRTYLGEIEVLNASSQSAMQLVASALNGVSVGSSVDWGGKVSYTGTL